MTQLNDIKALGIRNNNPGNLRKSEDPWQGLAAVQDDPSFFKFDSARMGIRALARILINYQDKYHLTTVLDIIQRWAPASDQNPTVSYARFVAAHMGVDPLAQINTHDYATLRGLVEGIICFENGLTTVPYDDVTMREAMRLAGVQPPIKPLGKVGEIKGAQVASVGVAGTGAASLMSGLQDAAGQLQPLIGYADEIKWLFLALTLIGIGWTVWASLRAHNEGVR